MTASFRMNQGVSGTYGLARQDLTVGTVTLEAENTLHSTYDWEITSEPEGSTSSIVGSGSSVTLNLTTTGGYLIRLTVDAGLQTEDVLELYAGVPLAGSSLCIPAFNETIQDNSESSTSKYGYERKLTRFLKWADTNIGGSASHWSRVTGATNYVYPSVNNDHVRIGDTTGDNWLDLYSWEIVGESTYHMGAIEAESIGLVIRTGDSQSNDYSEIRNVALFTHEHANAAILDFSVFVGPLAVIQHTPTVGPGNLSVLARAFNLTENAELVLSSTSGSQALSTLRAIGDSSNATTVVYLLSESIGTTYVSMYSHVEPGTGEYIANIALYAHNESDPVTADAIIGLNCASANGTALIEVGSDSVNEVRNEVKALPDGYFSWYSDSLERLRLSYASGNMAFETQNISNEYYVFSILHHQETDVSPAVFEIISSSTDASVGAELILHATTVEDNYSTVEIKSEGHSAFVDIIAQGVDFSGGCGVYILADVPDNAADVTIEAVSLNDVATIIIEASSDTSSAHLYLRAHGVGTPPTAGGNIVIGDDETHVIRFEDMNMDASTSWTQTYIYLSEADTEWDTFFTYFGHVSLINAINQAATLWIGGSLWQRTGTAPYILSPTTTGDVLRVGPGNAATNVAIGFEGTNNTGFYQRATTEIGLSVNGSTDSFFGRSEIGGTYGDRPSFMGEEPIGVVSYSDNSTNLGAGDLYLAAIRDTTDAGDSVLLINAENSNTTNGNGGSSLTVLAEATEDGATTDISSKITGTTAASILSTTNIHAYNSSTGLNTDAVVNIYAEAVNGGVGLVLLGNGDTSTVGFADEDLDYVTLGWTNAYLSFALNAADWNSWDEYFGSSISLLGSINLCHQEIIHISTGSTPLTSTSGSLSVNLQYDNSVNVSVTENITSISFTNILPGSDTYTGRRWTMRFVFTGSYTITNSGISGAIFLTGASDISGTSGDVYILHIDELGGSKRYCRVEGPYAS